MSFQLAPTGEFSGSGEVDSNTRQFDVKFRLVTDFDTDMGTAWGIAWNQIVLKYGLFRGCKLKSVQVDGKPETVGQVFEVSASYSTEEDDDDPYFTTLSFSTRGGREKKIHSYGTTAYTAANANIPAPDFKHGINFDNGVFQGVDIVVPQFGFSFDADFPSSVFSNAQVSYFHQLTGKTNFAPMWIFQQGEVLFTGMNGNSYRKKNENGTYELWFKVSFEFEAMPSVRQAEIAPFQGVTKKGMDYLWVFHQDQKDETSGISIPVPIACYVEKVYPYGDFSWFQNLHW
ncbi:MAG: hypothetical protein Q4E67_01735 [Planctomycetia bacterium]|nr:hypothetical protein [Planctomycetia bacterium]MDO5113074.1 hypothetical protein [Planctomycetia bacterium]